MTNPAPLAPVFGVLEAAGELVGVDWERAEDPALVAAAAALARVRALVDGALVGLTERLAATDAAGGAGWASTKDFLTHALGGRKGAGGGVVRLAERTADLPAVRAALTKGEVSAAQAGVIEGP